MNAKSLPGFIALLFFCGLVATTADRVRAADETRRVDKAETTIMTIDLQGHRGARGLYPENTIPGFLHALELGVTTLEMDVVINAEGHVVLSHEPWMSAEICRHPDGRDVTHAEERRLKIYEMSDQQVARFDCGSRGNARFPRQQPMPVAKPLLDQVLQSVAEWSSRSGNEAVRFSIEIKSRPEGDGVYHPGVDEFARILYEVLRDHGVLERSLVQSFDERALEAIHRIDPRVSTVWLIEASRAYEKNLLRLSFTPDVYSPYFKLVDRNLVEYMHSKNIQVIPWTVNEASDIRKMLDLGVDGLITDYPDLAIEVLSE
jgi:glycerophosphoryl diester phosphodiesterase